jgi:hypothetical protein
LNVSLPPQFAHTACLTLVDNGTVGAPHSGPASISGPLTQASNQPPIKTLLPWLPRQVIPENMVTARRGLAGS